LGGCSCWMRGSREVELELEIGMVVGI
jgi:hypothetical protein